MKFEEKELLEQHKKVTKLEGFATGLRSQMSALQAQFEKAKAKLGETEVEILVEKRILSMMSPLEDQDGDDKP